MAEPKVLIPLTVFSQFMSTPPTMDVGATIAGEPVRNQSHKNVPPLNARQQPKPNSKPLVKSKRKFMFTFIQTSLLVLALLFSTYSMVQLDSLPSQGSKGSDAHEMLVRTEGRVADSICTEGGAEIYIGNDLNSNGYLDEDEVTSSTKVCHGKEGLSGPQGNPGTTLQPDLSRIEIEELGIGSITCPTGGLLIHSGLDTDGDGQLGQDERESSEALCDGLVGSNGNNGQSGINGVQGDAGSQGAPALVEQRQPSPAVCPSGLILRFGVDDGVGEGVAFDEQLHDDEVRSSIQICSTPLLSGPISDFANGIADGVSPTCDAMAWMVEQQRLLTAGVNGVDGCELWVSEGFESSTQFLLDINPNGDALPGQYIGLNSVQTAYGERVFFDADDGVNGRELWVSDATVTGTKRVAANGDSIPLSSSTKVVKWGQGIVFNGANDALIWSNGVITTPVFSYPSFSPTQQQNLDTLSLGMATFATEMLHANATHLWFSAKAGNDIEPYLLTLDAELQSWDLNPTGASRPNAPLLIEDGLVAVAEAQNGRQLVRLSNDGNISWLTTLQHQGTGNPTTRVGEYLGIHQLGNLLVFDALTSGVDPQVWSHNLSSGQTQMLSTTIVAPGDWAGGLVHQQRIWFDCVAPNVAHEICSSDGTVSGTRVETDLRAGMASSNILEFASHGEHLFFLGSGQIDGIETGSTLWHVQKNGTPTLAYDPWPGVNNNSASGTYGELLLTEHHLFFISHDGIRGHEIHAWSHGERTGDWLIWS